MSIYTEKETPEKEYGLCECGCGEPAPISKINNKKYGWIKGEPKRFIHGHMLRGKDEYSLRQVARDLGVKPSLVYDRVKKCRDPWAPLTIRKGKGRPRAPELYIDTTVTMKITTKISYHYICPNCNEVRNLRWNPVKKFLCDQCGHWFHPKLKAPGGL